MAWEKIAMAAGSRMLRVGFGQHRGRPFFRIDLWKVGFRWTRERRAAPFSWRLRFFEGPVAGLRGPDGPLGDFLPDPSWFVSLLDGGEWKLVGIDNSGPPKAFCAVFGNGNNRSNFNICNLREEDFFPDELEKILTWPMGLAPRERLDGIHRVILAAARRAAKKHEREKP